MTRLKAGFMALLLGGAIGCAGSEPGGISGSAGTGTSGTAGTVGTTGQAGTSGTQARRARQVRPQPRARRARQVRRARRGRRARRARTGAAGTERRRGHRGHRRFWPGGSRWLAVEAPRRPRRLRRRHRRDDRERWFGRYRQHDGPVAERRLRQVRSAVGRQGRSLGSIAPLLPDQLRRHEAVPVADRAARLREPEHGVREPDDRQRPRHDLRPDVSEHARQRPVLEQLHRRRRPDPSAVRRPDGELLHRQEPRVRDRPTARARRCSSTSCPTRPTRST